MTESVEETRNFQLRVVGLEPNQKVYRMLVVDDNRENAELLVKLLQTIGFELRKTENGEEAIAIWKNWQPHLIWMNTDTPLIDGIGATKEIRAKEASQIEGENSSIQNLHTVIIALTNSTCEDSLGVILAADCDDFVVNPIPEAVIFEKIAEYLNVRYIYENLPLSRSFSLPQCFYSVKQISTFDVIEQLTPMSKNWVRQLYNEDVIQELIIEISENYVPFAKILKDLVKDFRFDIIVKCTQVVIND